ncbi:hypothetical protein CITRIK5_30408 [Citricoccus sp. K5]|nr:hypothetical protein CITRIK5_30408 [Citricoccus sp. K5]
MRAGGGHGLQSSPSHYGPKTPNGSNATNVSAFHVLPVLTDFPPSWPGMSSNLAGLQVSRCFRPGWP